jgi:hypothetical protein
VEVRLAELSQDEPEAERVAEIAAPARLGDVVGDRIGPAGARGR